jgi:isocitrate lyase
VVLECVKAIQTDVDVGHGGHPVMMAMMTMMVVVAMTTRIS